MNNNIPETPDFLIQWSDRSSHSSEQIYWDFPEQEKESKLRNGAASLHIDTTHIEVSDLQWDAPTSLSFTPNLIAFSCLISSTSTVEYGYGEGTTVTTGETGTLLFMLPGREIQARITPGRLRTVTCSFERSYAEGVIGPLQQLSPAKLMNALNMRSSLINSILLRLMQEAINPGPVSDQVLASLGQAILVECSHWLLASEHKGSTRSQLSASDFATIDQYLARATGKLPGVAELAAACGLSERYFARLFRQQTGSSVSQHIKALNISRAKSLLQETDMPLKEIAWRLGYSTSANFSSAFRAATGSTPGQFRKAR